MLTVTITSFGIINSNPMICEGFGAIIERLSSGFMAGFIAHNHQDLLSKTNAATDLPTILLVGISNPLEDSLASIIWVKEHHPNTSTIAYSNTYPKGCKRELAKAGCVGYLYYDDSIAVLQKSMLDVLDHGYIKNNRSDLIAELRSAYGDEVPKGKDLELLKLICSEMSYPEIGKLLFLSSRTIEVNVKALCIRFHVNNRHGLMCKVFEEEWL